MGAEDSTRRLLLMIALVLTGLAMVGSLVALWWRVFPPPPAALWWAPIAGPASLVGGALLLGVLVARFTKDSTRLVAYTAIGWAVVAGILLAGLKLGFDSTNQDLYLTASFLEFAWNVLGLFVVGALMAAGVVTLRELDG